MKPPENTTETTPFHQGGDAPCTRRRPSLDATRRSTINRCELSASAAGGRAHQSPELKSQTRSRRNDAAKKTHRARPRASEKSDCGRRPTAGTTTTSASFSDSPKPTVDVTGFHVVSDTGDSDLWPEISGDEWGRSEKDANVKLNNVTVNFVLSTVVPGVTN